MLPEGDSVLMLAGAQGKVAVGETFARLVQLKVDEIGATFYGNTAVF